MFHRDIRSSGKVIDQSSSGHGPFSHHGQCNDPNALRCKKEWSQARSQVKIPEGAKSFAMKSTRQGSNYSELLRYSKCIGCNGMVVQLMVQLHPMHPSGFGPGYLQHNLRRPLLLPSRKENISSLSAAVQHNFRRALLLPSRGGEDRVQLSTGQPTGHVKLLDKILP